jgi:hypothetical protein
VRVMPPVIDLEKGRLHLAAKRGFRNWVSGFGEDFGLSTRLGDLSIETLGILAKGKESGAFYIYDLTMNLQNMGSAFEFNELDPRKKMAIIDRYIFILDLLRFEIMKRLGWLESYPGEPLTLVELVLRFEEVAPDIQAKPPHLSKDHPGYQRFMRMNVLDREVFVRKLIPQALKAVEGYSTTL